jgi:demethylmenaquinone methyltransferase/2-methoxy-6-polyprenyl-1,4-benzoquinol methylase
VGRGRALSGPAAPEEGRGDGDSGAPRVDRDPGAIAGMFGRIAPRYDLMNRLMTAGLDRGWRQLAAAEARLQPGDHALDVCCGTGDLSFALLDRWPGVEVTGLDFTAEMLEVARDKAAQRRVAAAPDGTTVRIGDRAGGCSMVPVPTFVQGDLLALPFADDLFAAVTVGWGVRNVPDLPRALAEMTRVTRPGGRVVCLESTRPPEGVGRQFHRVWFDRVVPALGRAVADEGGAYEYLPASVRDFPTAERLAELMSAAGLTNVRYRRLGFGAVALHVAEKPGGATGGAA